MTVRRYSSISQETTLVSPINTTATTMVVNSASVLGGITIADGERMTLVIDPDTALEEIVYAIYPSAPGSTTITIIRGVDGTGTEGTSGIAHSAGAKVRHMAIGVDFREANNHIKNETTAHGLTIANVLETTDTNMITTAMLQSSAVTTAKIADANVTAAKLASDSVTTAKILDSNVTTAKIADLNVTTGKIADSAVTSAKIADGTIATGDIADSAITSAKIADGTIVAGDIADGAVTSAKILDDTIVNADINSAAAIAATKVAGTAVTQADTGTVTSTMILDGTILNADINASAAIAYSKLDLAGSVTSADIANGTIVDADVSGTAAIAYTKLSLGGTITSADIVDGTIVNSDINASAAIALSKLATDPLARANHTGTQTASTISDFDTQVRTSKVTDLAAPTGSFSMNSQKITNLATPTDNTDASTKAYVDTKVADLVNSAPSTLDTLGEIATAIEAGGTVYESFVLKTGSTMTGALTLSGAPTVDLHAATKAYVDTVAGSATAAAASAAAAAASYDSFDDRYLGAKASAPSVDNDGNALVTGALYWDTVSNAMYAWTGSEWGSISSTAAIYRYRFTASGGETSISGTDDNGLTLSYLPGKEQVYLNGVLLARTSDYTASNGTSLTSLAALAASDIVEIITFTSFELATALVSTDIDAKGDLFVGTAADTVGKLTVGANGETLVADSSTSTGLRYQVPVNVNPILNSSFQIWQRGTSFAAPAAGAYLADRWNVGNSGAAGRTYSRQTASLDGFQYCIRGQRDSGNTGTGIITFSQSLETVNSIPYQGKTVMVSFYARAGADYSAASSALGITLATGTGTDQKRLIGDPATYTGNSSLISSSVTLTTSWQRFTRTATLATTATEIAFGFQHTPVGTAGAADYFEVTGVQLEVGSVATPYKSYAGTIQGELAACQRYYVRWGGSVAYEYLATGIAGGTTTMDTVVPMPVTMRVAPTSIDYSTLACYDTSGVYAGTNFTLQAGTGKQTVQTRLTVASGLVQYRPYFLITNNSTSGYIGFSAEL